MTTVVSAPGKVLIAGGYLVLDPTYPGLVIATDSRFYTVVQPRSGSASESSKAAASAASIRVRSPQFIGAFWEYVPSFTSVEGKEHCRLHQTEQTYAAADAGENPFLSLAILYSLRLATELRGSAEVARILSDGLDISVVGDNDFYSQRAPSGDKDKPLAPTTEYLRSLPPFNPQPCVIRKVNKTGLGSSAAMTTSVVGALLVHLCGPSLEPTTDSKKAHNDASRTISPYSRAFIHNLAQLAHCAAQGKVGSGFDVSSATWGSQLFRRFDPAVLEPLMAAGASSKVTVQGASEQTQPEIELLPHVSPRNALWIPSPLTSETADQGTHPTALEGLAATTASPLTDGDRVRIAQPAPLQLPPRVSLVLADVNSGSNTRTLVGNVSKWKKEKPAWAAQLFKVIASSNQSLADGLLALRLAQAQDPKGYDEVIELAASKKSKEWDEMMRKTSPSETLRLLIDVRNALRSIRAGMRELGQLAKADIEPERMGAVLRASIDAAPGILGGGVPGAGGYDALYILHLSPPSHAGGADTSPARKTVEELWAGWKDMSVGPLLSTAGGAVALDAGDDSAIFPSASAMDGLADEVRQALKLASESAKGSKAGLCIEELGQVPGLREALAQSQ